jgi:hypothetical protein
MSEDDDNHEGFETAGERRAREEPEVERREAPEPAPTPERESDQGEHTRALARESARHRPT